MIIEPKIRGFICTTAHPLGCQQNIRQQVAFASAHPLTNAPKRVLIIGGSAGYGLSSRVVSAFGGNAATLSVSFEKPAKGNKTASAGWYNNHYFEQEAKASGLYAESINGDAFTAAIKTEVAEKIKRDLGSVDLVVYSLAAPKRYCDSQEKYVSSALKPIGEAIEGQSVDTNTLTLSPFSVAPATQSEVDNTVFVMGGSDWYEWMTVLSDAGVLAPSCKTVAFSYLGGELTRSVYMDGTIGKAKENLEENAERINTLLKPIHADASVAVLKAIVTQSSAAIPSFSLYISLLYKVMKEKGVHENCIEQISRLMQTGLYGEGCHKDKPYRYRLDNLELQDDVQHTLHTLWQNVSDEGLHDIADVHGYQNDFYQLFGFAYDEVDYQAPVDLAAV